MNVLDKICADKRDHVSACKDRVSVYDIQAMAQDQPPARGFISALQNSAHTPLITEVKKASPSKGVIRDDFDPVKIAKIYEDHGAACLSVLTDEKYFQGHDDYFTAIRNTVFLPMLRKDFMVDPYQIYESRVLGADCVLLIMACLGDEQAKEFYDLSVSLGMDVLVEVHDEEEMQRALKLTPQMIGVNNRNLKTLDVDLNTGILLAEKIPDSILKVAESGIYNPADIEKFLGVGYRAFLIGESLMRENDIGRALEELLR
jgi:indole-3-glycerol phosphate synthase